MSRPRAHSRSSARSSSRSSEKLTGSALAEALAGFDFVEGALDDISEELNPTPERSPKQRGPVGKPSDKKGAAPGSHYFSPSAPLEPGQEYAVRVRAAGADLSLQAGAATFSKSELDDGTRLLLDTFALSSAFDAAAGAKWCDLGCGWGAVASVLGSRKPEAQVWACDINERAAALCALNVQQLKLENVVVWNGDGLTACRDNFFDAILCNPPVRAGNRVIEGMFEGAKRCLKEEGELWVVLRTSQGARSWQKKLAAQFGQCDTMEIWNGFRILKAWRGEAR